MLKKPITTTFLFLGIGIITHAQTIYVKEKKGTQISYLIGDINKISFSSGNMIIDNKTGNTSTYSLTNIRFLNFTNLFSGISDPKQTESSTFSVFPNPVKEFLNIRCKSAINRKVQITISDIQGKTVYNTFILPQEISNNSIDVSHLPKGIYLCRLYNGINVSVIKFIKS
jgi:hypothetical protein